MEHKGTVRLETERLILRKFAESDIESSYRNWTSDDKTTKYLTWFTHENIGVTKQVVLCQDLVQVKMRFSSS